MQSLLEPLVAARNSMMAESPFSHFTAGVTLVVFAAGVLIAVLLIGAFVVVNLGFLSKPNRDRIGDRNPSDLGLMRNTFWPQTNDEEKILPAEERDDEEIFERKPPKRAA